MIYKRNLNLARFLRRELSSHWPMHLNKGSFGLVGILAGSGSPRRQYATNVPWRLAASIILVAEADHPEAPPKFLIMKRSKGSSFLGGALCFPGGAMDKFDSDSQWMRLYEANAGTSLASADFMENGAVRPPLYGLQTKSTVPTDPKSFQSFGELRQALGWRLRMEAVLRLTAIRELFEECGILLCRELQGVGVVRKVGLGDGQNFGKFAHSYVFESPEEVEEWQEEVRKDASALLKLCFKKKLLPDLNSLVDWSNWLTPNSFPTNHRFDTIFYVATLPHVLPFLPQGAEVASLQWVEAREVLSNEKVRIIPPQIYELSRMQGSSVRSIQRLARMRTKFGLPRICPCWMRAKDGLLSVLPGDDLYPTDYKLEESEEMREREETLEELLEASRNHHRIEFLQQNSQSTSFKLRVNIKPMYGQIYQPD